MLSSFFFLKQLICNQLGLILLVSLMFGALSIGILATLITDLVNINREIDNNDFISPNHEGAIKCIVTNYDFPHNMDNHNITVWANITRSDDTDACYVGKRVQYYLHLDEKCSDCNLTALASILDRKFYNRTAFPCKVNGQCDNFILWTDHVDIHHNYKNMPIILIFLTMAVLSIVALFSSIHLLVYHYRDTKLLSQKLLDDGYQLQQKLEEI